MSVRVLRDLAQTAADETPERIAALQGEETLTYGTLCEQSRKLAAALVEMGLRKGDRVCVFLEKRFEKITAIFGTAFAGGVVVPIRKLAQPAQVAHILVNCGARVLITTFARISGLMTAISEAKSLELIVSVEDSRNSPNVVIEGTRLVHWSEIMKQGLSTAPDLEITESDLAAILYTSGSTGKPKGVVLNHQNVVTGAKTVSEYLKINRDDRILSILTFAFDYGLNQLTTSVLKRAQLILLDFLFPKDIVTAVEKHAITGLGAVSSTWIQILNLPWDTSRMGSLRYVTNSGGSLPVIYVQELQKRLPNTEIFLMYGLTEAFRSTYLDPVLVEKYPSSIGRALPGQEIMVLDENDRPVKDGEVGELVHRGVLVAQGYWGDPESTAARFRKNPFQNPTVILPEIVVYSGDYVRVDENGLLYYVGRRDEMIKSAGNRISPSEVEEIIYDTGLISEAVALGVPHPVYGQAVMAVVAVKAGCHVTAGILKTRLRERMPPFMLPSEIAIWEALPRMENGKLDRSAIKNQVYAKHKVSMNQ